MTISRRRICGRRILASSRFAGRSRTRWQAWIYPIVLLCAGWVHGATTFKIATISPDGSSWMKAMRAGGKEVEAVTDGRVKFKFYPGGIKGDDQTVLKLMRARQLHGGVVTTGVFNQIYTDVQLYNLPMQFVNLEEVDAVRSKIDPVLMAGLEEAGFVTFGVTEVGSAYAMGKKPATSVDAAKRLKVWTPDGDPAALRALQAFDIAPIPSPIANVLTGLQTGLIDTVTTPPVAAIALQWHTQVDYLLDLPLMYVYGLFVVSKSHFGRLDDADQAAVRRIMGDVVRKVDRQNRADHVATFQVLLDRGVERLVPTDAERAQWQQYADAAAQSWVDEGIVSAPLYERLQSELGKLRAPVAP